MKKYILLIASMLGVMCGCSDDSNPSDSAPLYDIVCLEADTPAGSVFTLTKPGNRAIVTLTAAQRIDTDVVRIGDRLLLMYVADSGVAYRSGSVTVKGYGTIVNGLLRETDDVPPAWDRDPVYLLSAWQSGHYLNIHARLPYDENPRDFTLAMPAVQTDPSCPDIYLVHALEADVTTFSRAYYASFDISRIVDDHAITGFTLHVNNSNLSIDEIKFNK
ncbi:MAG: hypothetical protein K2L73_06275 [Muribaculaceae bacterium]|nr:hypothetical protein [Muribaculaceae bacterium]